MGLIFVPAECKGGWSPRRLAHSFDSSMSQPIHESRGSAGRKWSTLSRGKEQTRRRVEPVQAPRKLAEVCGDGCWQKFKQYLASQSLSCLKRDRWQHGKCGAPISPEMPEG